MYILFREFHWEPSRYYLMPEGEKTVTRAFLKQWKEELDEEQEAVRKSLAGSGRM